MTTYNLIAPKATQEGLQIQTIDDAGVITVKPATLEQIDAIHKIISDGVEIKDAVPVVVPPVKAVPADAAADAEAKP